MKAYAWLITAALLLGSGLVVFAGDEEDLPKASDGWPMVLLEDPFHIGDDVMEHYLHPRPMGGRLERRFVLDQGAIGVYVGLWFISNVGPEHRRFRQGYYQHKLYVNGKEIAVINRNIPRRRSPTHVNHAVYRLNARDMKAGINELVIVGGARGGNISELEIHRIELSLTRLGFSRR